MILSLQIPVNKDGRLQVQLVQTTKTEKDQIWRYVTTKVDYSALKYEIVSKVYETKHF